MRIWRDVHGFSNIVRQTQMWTSDNISSCRSSLQVTLSQPSSPPRWPNLTSKASAFAYFCMLVACDFRLWSTGIGNCYPGRSDFPEGERKIYGYHSTPENKAPGSLQERTARGWCLGNGPQLLQRVDHGGNFYDCIPLIQKKCIFVPVNQFLCRRMWQRSLSGSCMELHQHQQHHQRREICQDATMLFNG